MALGISFTVDMVSLMAVGRLAAALRGCARVANLREALPGEAAPTALRVEAGGEAATRRNLAGFDVNRGMVSGITSQIMREAMEQARRGRLFILDKMEETITGHREKISSFAPRIYTLHIPVDKIRDLIGPGGKMIRQAVANDIVAFQVFDPGEGGTARGDYAGTWVAPVRPLLQWTVEEATWKH